MRATILDVVQSTPVRLLLPVAWMGVIFALSHQPTLPYPENVNSMVISTLGHVGVYAILATLVWWALGITDVSHRWRIVIPVAIAFLYGLTDEWHQSFVPGRTPDVRDIVADTIGAVLAMVVVTWLVRRGILDANL